MASGGGRSGWRGSELSGFRPPILRVSYVYVSLYPDLFVGPLSLDIGVEKGFYLSGRGFRSDLQSVPHY